VDTHGVEPILIDFQRSVKYRAPCQDVGAAADEIAFAYDIIARWCDKRAILGPIIDRLSVVDTMEELLDIIQQI
jgi:hypothetical protein